MSQQQRGTALYRALLKTTRSLFVDDVRARNAAHMEARRQFLEKRGETDAEKIEENLTMGEQVEQLFRQNVVQGVANKDPYTYSRSATNPELRFTEQTELGSNDSVKVPRPAPSLDEIRRSRNTRKRSAGMHTWAVPARGPAACRTYATRASDAAPLPRPVPRFPQRVILADGSSIQMTTTSPRHLSRLTRDVTNHPLWNPGMGRRTDAEAEDDTGRLGRFRRRFAEEAAQVEEAASVVFDENDLDWMSGGREAREGTPMVTKKAKGKGKK